MKAVLRASPIVLLLVTLLTWLMLQSVGPPGEDYVLAQRDVARVALGEAGLRRDVLLARAGLLQNYDPLVTDIADLRRFALQLHAQARVRPEDHEFLDAMMTVVERDGSALERFKTDNALLQNSLFQFNGLDAELVDADIPPPSAAAIASAGNAVLRLIRDPTVPSQQIVRQRLEVLNKLAQVCTNPWPGKEVHLLAVHARFLSDLIPGVSADIRDLFSISTYQLRQDIRASQDARRTAEEVRADRSRLALYGVAILLLITLVRVGFQWRAGQRLLAQRTELERLIASISTRFISLPFDRYDEVLDEVIARLGSGLRADRAYLLLLGSPKAAAVWCRPGIDIQAAWPGTVLEPALAAVRDADELIDVPAVTNLPAIALREALRAAGNAGWCGIVLRTGDEPAGLLAFDRVSAASPWPRGGPGMVRMAGEVIRNVLQRREAAAARLELEARLGRARRLEAIGTFASGIAHNFNNVLGAVLGQAEMAADLTPGDAPTADHVREIRRAGERGQELVRRILDFGSRGLEHRAVAIDALLSETLSMLRVLLPADISLVMEPRKPDYYVCGDAAQIQQTLVNLVRNAAEAMPGGGRVMLQVEAERVLVPRDLSHDTLRRGEYVRICVVDAGIGMSDATLANIFRPFFTTRAAGTGLGLATVREIVHDHGGALDVRSILQGGSVFAVWLPAARVPTLPQSATQRGTGQIVMMLSPDDTVMHNEEMLAALGYEPVGFTDAEVALTACRVTPGRFDALLIDLPKLNREHRELVDRFRHTVPSVPIILVTPRSSESMSGEMSVSGARLVLHRPLRSVMLANALAACFSNVA